MSASARPSLSRSPREDVVLADQITSLTNYKASCSARHTFREAVKTLCVVQSSTLRSPLLLLTSQSCRETLRSAVAVNPDGSPWQCSRAVACRQQDAGAP